ncbi:MAG: NAD(+) kinase [Gammaproteobacteria bacterium]|nr:NAD(+) kinase [Gammaproteobacteria bacterium]
MNKKFRKIALVGKHRESAEAKAMVALGEHLLAAGREVLLPEATAGKIGLPGAQACTPEKLAATADLLIAIGGDGTMLEAASLVAGTKTPVLGINRGRLGFLADIGQAEMLPKVDEVLAGNYQEDQRLYLEVALSSGAKEQTLNALNDVVIQRSETGRMVDIETTVDGQYVNTHTGDGLIIATATGSTAYALSCGGPIIQPSLDALLLVPVCPHTLSDRPIVIPANSAISLRLARSPRGNVPIFCDGHLLGNLGENQTLSIRASKHRLTLIHPADYDYYRMLRSKLRWGDSSRSNREPTT